MKVKSVILSAAVGTALVVGIAYVVGTSMRKKAQPVEVVSVPSVNQAAYGMMDSSTLYGSIVSRDTQNVELDTNYEVKNVYVQTGDKVKKGDKLMEYDMELVKLEREAQDLTKQGLELSLETMQKDLATMQSGKLPANYGESTDPFFGGGASSDVSWDDSDEDLSDDEGDNADLSDDDSDYTMSADTPGGNVSAAEDDAGTSGSGDGEIVQEEEPDEGTSSDPTGLGSGEQVILDGGDDGDSTVSQDEESVVSENGGTSAGADTETLGYVTAFLNDVNALTQTANEGFDNLASDSAAKVFQEAFGVFRDHLAETGETTVTDLFGASRTIYLYSVSGSVSAMVGDVTAQVLQQAYDRLCIYQFISAVRQIFPGQMQTSETYSYDQVTAAAEQIHTAADAFYQLQSGIYSVSDEGTVTFSTEFSALNAAYGDTQSYADYLLGLIRTLNSDAATIFPDVPQTETDMTEPDIHPDDGGGGEDDGGDGTSAEDLKAAIEQQKKDIVECQLEIREANLEVREKDRILAKETITATLDGIVKQAGTTSERPSSGAFIVVTGKTGMYVQGTLSERSLDTLKVGDTITGSSWDTGGSFSARITEISEFPSDSGTDSMYFYDSTGDKNSSQYPFLAYIEEADGLTPGSYVELNIDTEADASGLTLASYMVRMDSSGRSFCYVRGEDGNLEKRYVKTKDDGYGSTQILKGLRASDYIAFPYGDDVKNGAPTKEVETLSAVGGSYY